MVREETEESVARDVLFLKTRLDQFERIQG
jgi:hypothetical protein